MHRIAVRSLFFDKGKLIAALAGVAFASTLVLVQLGVYEGFVRASAALVTRAGGDVWVMARGTAVLDNGRPLPASTRFAVAEHPCVTAVRAVGVAYVTNRSPEGSEDGTLVVGYEPSGPTLLPWSLARGLPQDLHAPMRIAVDEADLGKLHVRGEAIGAKLDLGGRDAVIAALTFGVKSFTLSPYIFAEMPTLRALARMGDGEASYWVADLASPTCAPEVARWVERDRELQVRTAQEFATSSEEYWVSGSGAGSVITFGAVLALAVGSIIVAQTLYAITKEYAKELATLKTVGATTGQLLMFVGWQAATLAVVGSALGAAMALAIVPAAELAGVVVAFTPRGFTAGLALIAAMCAVASLASVRAILRLEAAEVFK